MLLVDDAVTNQSFLCVLFFYVSWPALKVYVFFFFRLTQQRSCILYDIVNQHWTEWGETFEAHESFFGGFVGNWRRNTKRRKEKRKGMGGLNVLLTILNRAWSDIRHVHAAYAAQLDSLREISKEHFKTESLKQSMHMATANLVQKSHTDQGSCAKLKRITKFKARILKKWTKVVLVALDEDIDIGQWSFQFINHYIQGDSGPKPKIIEVTDQLLFADLVWPSPWCLVRPPSSAPVIIFFFILFFNCCSESASQPSWDTLPFRKPQKSSTSWSLATLGGFLVFAKNGISSSSKRVVVGRAK